MKRILQKADLTLSVLWKHPTFGFESTWIYAFCFTENWINQKRSHFLWEREEYSTGGKKLHIGAEGGREGSGASRFPWADQGPRVHLQRWLGTRTGVSDQRLQGEKHRPAGSMPRARRTVAGNSSRWLLTTRGSRYCAAVQGKTPFPCRKVTRNDKVLGKAKGDALRKVPSSIKS